MKLYSKILFVVILCSAIGVSVWFSFNTISRPTFEYSEQTDIGGTGASGWVFDGFNGNSSTETVRVYYAMEKNTEREGAESAAYIENTDKPVAGIDKFTFVSDESMKYCYIGPSVRYIDERAFFGCFALRAVIVDDANPYYTDIDGVLYSKDMKTILVYPHEYAAYLIEKGEREEGFEETYVVPEGVEEISVNCFYKCWGLKSVILPSTLKTIQEMAFFKCESLSLIALPDGIEAIGADAFAYCSNMRWALYIPESVKNIDHHCFYKCDSLEKFYMGSKNEDGVTLGGAWQPKSENSFVAEPPEFGKTRADVDAYNAEKQSQADAEAAKEEETAKQTTAEAAEETTAEAGTTQGSTVSVSDTASTGATEASETATQAEDDSITTADSTVAQ